MRVHLRWVVWMRRPLHENTTILGRDTPYWTGTFLHDIHISIPYGEGRGEGHLVAHLYHHYAHFIYFIHLYRIASSCTVAFLDLNRVCSRRATGWGTRLRVGTFKWACDIASVQVDVIELWANWRTRDSSSLSGMETMRRRFKGSDHARNLPEIVDLDDNEGIC